MKNTSWKKQLRTALRVLLSSSQQLMNCLWAAQPRQFGRLYYFCYGLALAARHSLVGREHQDWAIAAASCYSPSNGKSDFLNLWSLWWNCVLFGGTFCNPNFELLYFFCYRLALGTKYSLGGVEYQDWAIAAVSRWAPRNCRIIFLSFNGTFKKWLFHLIHDKFLPKLM